MRNEITPEIMTDDEEINDVIKKCTWRKNVQGISVCRGMAGACSRVIESGKCDTLREYFQNPNSQRGYVPMGGENEGLRGEDKQ